jgi:hypothetical protein
VERLVFLDETAVPQGRARSQDIDGVREALEAPGTTLRSVPACPTDLDRLVGVLEVEDGAAQEYGTHPEGRLSNSSKARQDHAREESVNAFGLAICVRSQVKNALASPAFCAVNARYPSCEVVVRGEAFSHQQRAPKKRPTCYREPLQAMRYHRRDERHRPRRSDAPAQRVDGPPHHRGGTPVSADQSIA